MIDDDPAFLDIMARTMRSDGYHARTAGDAETGFSLVQAIKPQVITLDLLLPDQHGWLLFERIKADPTLQDIPGYYHLNHQKTRPTTTRRRIFNQADSARDA